MADKLKLEDTLRESKAEVARQEGAIRLLDEQNQDLEVRITELIQRIEELETQAFRPGQPGEVPGRLIPEELAPVEIRVGPSGAVGPPKIVGKIVAIRNDIASIDVGSAQGVRENMRMVITHNARFVGYLEIYEVDPGAAAGIVKDKQVEPQVGDTVSFPPPAKTD